MLKKSLSLYPVLLLAFFLSAGSCFNDGEKFDDNAEVVNGNEAAVDSSNANAGGTVLRKYGNCYLKNLGSGKKLLHLEGSPYEMGYAMGYLVPDEVRRITSLEYFMAVVDSAGDKPISPLFTTWMKNLALEVVAFLTRIQLGYIPSEYIAEMKGIVAGVNDATPGVRKLKFNDVLLLNVANDVLFTFMYKAEQLGLYNSCGGFVVTGNATADGGTLMGRHFMYPPEVFNEIAMLIEYLPENGYPFVSVTTPGFVGVTSAMNSRGVSIGMDVLHSGDVNFAKAGMGTLLLARKAVQYCDSVDSVVNIIRKTTRGVPWMYIIADSKGGGAVVESTTNHFAVRYLDSQYPDQIEQKDDVVVIANHAIVPEIAAIQTENPVLETERRYAEMTNLILDNYGMIDISKGREIIDFLHPGGDYSWLYGTGLDQPVACTVSLYDLNAKEVWSLYGKYSDKWVRYKLPY